MAQWPPPLRTLVHRMHVYRYVQGFLRCLGTRNGSLESEKIIIGSLKSEEIESLESEKSGPCRSKPGT